VIENKEDIKHFHDRFRRNSISSETKKALTRFGKLMQKNSFLNEEQKLHFAEFSDILRRYIGASLLRFVTFEKTTQSKLSNAP
jgi:hypothetical protein